MSIERFKRKSIGKMALFIIMAVFILFFIVAVRTTTITSMKKIGKQQNYNMEKEPIKCQIEQSIEKYINIEEGQVLLQQKIVVNSNKNEIKKEKEELYINVPKIQENIPNSIEILANGIKLENSNYSYNVEKNQIKVEITDENIGTYKIIYLYEEATTMTEDICLNTRTYTKFENKEEIETQDEKIITIMPIGEKISIQGENTKEVYKGYLYEARKNETEYEEKYILEISNIQNVSEMKIEKVKEVYLSATSENDTNQSTYFKKTIVNKSQMLRILGQEGKITIQNEEGETIQEITKDSDEDKNGDVVINYNLEEIKNIKVLTTEALQIGELEIKNQKAISSNVGYSKQEIEQFEMLETTIRANKDTNILQMKLLDTKSEAKMTMEKKTLSALTKNEDVQMVVTLLSNCNQYELYKNPVVEIFFPKEFNINIKNITQLNLEEQLQIRNTDLYESENEKILKIDLEGEQQNYIQNMNQGIQISIIVDIEIPITTSLKEANIGLGVTNENKQGTFRTDETVKIDTKYGVLMVNNISNYNEDQEMIQTIDDQENSMKIDTYSDEKKAMGQLQIINNYENAISEMIITGMITEQEEMGICFENIEPGIDAKIYYSENNKDWTEDIEKIGEIKSYKIVINNEMQNAENMKISYSLQIPKNINIGTKSYIQTTIEYKYQNHRERSVSNIKCITKNKQSNMFLTTKETEEQEQLKVEISAMSGNQFLKDGDVVKEGQGIRYKIRLTNQGDMDLSNIQLEATNTNAIYYDLISYEELVDFAPYTKYKVEENEALTSKKLEIDLLKPGETKEVSYQISVKQVEDNNQNLDGEIKIVVDNKEEMVIQNISNKIEKSEIKTSLKFLYSQDVTTCEGSGFPLQILVKNISENELHDLIVEMPLADQFNDFTENDIILTENDPFEILEYKDRVLRFKIPTIEVGNSVKIVVKLMVGQVDLEKKLDTISQYVKVINKEKEYISNDVEKEIEQTFAKIIATQTTNKEGNKIKNGEQIKFLFTIENRGVVEKDISISDKIPSGLRVQSAKIKTGEGENEVDISNRLLVTEAIIKPNEIIELEIDTIVDVETMKGQEIENYAEISGMNLSVQSNKLSFFIELDLEEEDKDEDNNDNNGDENNDNDNPENTDTFNISGVVWLDKNEDGKRDADETNILDVPVFLLNEDGKIEALQKTRQDGSYCFENIKSGNYIVVFQYDTNKYIVTAYQKDSVRQEVNSDVMHSTIEMNQQKIAIAKTKTLELQSQDLENIDAGLIEKKKFDLKIDKTIQKITIQDDKGTKVNSYNKSQLAKIEIDAKQLNKTKISIEYNIAIHNQGEVSGYANEIIDYLPQGLTLNEDMKGIWHKNSDGSFSTKSLANQIILPNETKNITLVVSKNIAQEDIGTITNKAKIGSYSNDNITKDIEDSNNESQAEVIVSIRTGRIILYLSLMIIVAIIIVVSIGMIKKKIL